MKHFEDEILLIQKLDKLKFVVRASDTLDGAKKENSAEHSWQCAAMALLFSKHVEGPLDMQKVLSILIVHDMGEIEAGDINLYEEYISEAYNAEEMACIRNLFEKHNPDLVEVWKEFEKGESKEAKFAKAIDRIAGILSSHFNPISCWNEEGMTVEKILSRNIAIKEGFPAFWPFFNQLLSEAERDGKIGNGSFQK